MKVIDQKGRLFGKISIIDVVIIIAVALVAVAMYVVFVKGGSQVSLNTEQEKVVYTIEMTKVNEAFTKQPQIGGTVYNSSKNYYIGEIVDIKVMPNQSIEENYKEGTYNLVDQPHLYRTWITIEADADVSEQAIMVGSQEIKLGQQLPVKGKGFAGMSFIIKVDLVEGGN